MPVILQQAPSQLAPKFTEIPTQPAKHLAFDIETGNAREDDIELVQQFAKANGNIKDPEKAKASLEEKRAKLAEKSALLDSAPISCITIVTESQQAIFYHRGYPWPKAMKPVTALKGCAASISCLKDEIEMLVTLRDWLDGRAVPDSILIAHNAYGFDLPKLRIAYLRSHLTLPKVLQPEAKDAGVEVFDTMQRFLRYFTTERAGDRYITLEEMVARLGLPSHKQQVRGEDVPRMAAEGKTREVLTYNYLDTLSTYAAFLAMTSQYKDQIQ